MQQAEQVRESVVHDKLADYIEDALALEESVVDQLDSMISSVERSPDLMELLQRHRQVSRLQVERLKSRLERLGRGTPVRKRIEGMALTLIKNVSDVLRTDAPGKVGRDAYLLAHTQLAAYELLSRTASAAGDSRDRRSRPHAPRGGPEVRRRGRRALRRLLPAHARRLAREGRRADQTATV